MTVQHKSTISGRLHDTIVYCVCMLQVLQVIDACTDIAYDVTAPAAGGVVSSRSVFLYS